MTRFSLLYYLLFGIPVFIFLALRVRGIYRFVRIVMKIRGPPWWKLAFVYSKELLGDDTITFMCKICSEYGYKPWSLFMTTLDFLVVISDVDSVCEVFKNPHMCDKSQVLYGGFSYYIEKGSLVLNGEKWKWHRKTVSPAFRKRNLDSRIDMMSEGAENIVKVFQSKADGPSFDITDIVDFETTDFSLRFITSGVPIVPGSKRFYEAVERGMSLVQSKTLNPLKHWFLLRFDKKTREADRLAREVIQESVPIFKQAQVLAKKRMSDRKDTQPLDVIECLSQTTLEPANKDIDDEELLDEALTMAVGAIETSKTSIKTALLLLALNPDIQERAYQELQEIFGDDDRRPTPQDLTDMKYIHAIMKEMLRLYPSIPMIGRKVNRTTRINGTVIPRGACVIINIMALHRNPNIYEDPLRFLPERFLAEGEEKRHPYAFIPFGAGPRTCVGFLQATMTLKIALAAILRKFVVLPGENIKSMDDLKIKMSVTITIREPTIRLITRKKELNLKQAEKAESCAKSVVT